MISGSYLKPNRIPCACCTFETFVDWRQNIPAIKSKQASSSLEIQNLNELSFKCLLTFLSSLIIGLLEVWLGLLTFILG